MQTTTLLKEDRQTQFDLLRTEYINLLNDKNVLLQWGKPHVEALYNTRVGFLQIEKLQRSKPRRFIEVILIRKTLKKPSRLVQEMEGNWLNLELKVVLKD